MLFRMPEKSLMEIPRALREQYDKGKAAYDRQNYDYALAILSQVLQKEPGFFDCRQTLRASQYKKSGASGGWFKKALSGAGSTPLLAKGQVLLRTNPAEALVQAEQILNSDYNSSGGHKLLAEAAMKLDLPKTAILSLEILLKGAPKDRDLLLLLARAYSAGNEIDKAETLFTDLYNANPGDQEISNELKNLSARKTMKDGGYDNLAKGGSYRDIMRNKDEAVSLEQENRQVKSEDVAGKLILEYEARLASEPDNLKLVRSIADLYLERKEFDRAIEYYTRIQKAGAGDSSLDKAISDATLKKLDVELGQIDPQAPDAAERTARIKTERDQFTLAETRQRVERYPNDLQLRFELGQLYFKLGKITEAIQELQKAQNHPQRRIQSMTLLGQCFAHRGMNDMAARKLQEALAAKTNFDDEKKDLLYVLGSVFEKMGKVEEAIEQFKQIYEVDIGYRDVAAKVDIYYGGK